MKTFQSVILLLLLAMLSSTSVAAKGKVKNAPYDRAIFENAGQCTALLVIDIMQRQKGTKRLFQYPPTMPSYGDPAEMVNRANLYALAYETDKKGIPLKEAQDRVREARSKATMDLIEAMQHIVKSPIKDKSGVVSSYIERKLTNCALFYDILEKDAYDILARDATKGKGPASPQ